MTAEIVNLRRARKAKARASDEAAAAENRIRFGRTKDERQAVEGACIAGRASPRRSSPGQVASDGAGPGEDGKLPEIGKPREDAT